MFILQSAAKSITLSAPIPSIWALLCDKGSREDETYVVVLLPSILPLLNSKSTDDKSLADEDINVVEPAVPWGKLPVLNINSCELIVLADEDTKVVGPDELPDNIEKLYTTESENAFLPVPKKPDKSTSILVGVTLVMGAIPVPGSEPLSKGNNSFVAVLQLIKVFPASNWEKSKPFDVFEADVIKSNLLVGVPLPVKVPLAETGVCTLEVLN